MFAKTETDHEWKIDFFRVNKFSRMKILVCWVVQAVAEHDMNDESQILTLNGKMELIEFSILFLQLI